MWLSNTIQTLYQITCWESSHISFYLDLLHLIFLDWSIRRLVGWFVGSFKIYSTTNLTKYSATLDKLDKLDTSFWFLFILQYFYRNSKLCFSKASISSKSIPDILLHQTSRLQLLFEFSASSLTFEYSWVFFDSMHHVTVFFSPNTSIFLL